MSHHASDGGGASRRTFLVGTAIAGAGLAAPWVLRGRRAFAQAAPVVADPRFTAPVIDPAAIPKFVDPLPVPGSTWPVLTGTSLSLSVQQVNAQVLPQGAVGFPALATPCWGYRAAGAYTSTYLGPTIVGQSGVPTTVTFSYAGLNPAQHLLKTGNPALAGAATVVDKHLHGTDAGEPEVRFIAHKHGSVGVSQESDGYAESWVSPDGRTAASLGMPSPVGFEPGSNVAAASIVHRYPNSQGACLAWYHDHGLGITRLNVYAGLAAGFLITDGVEAGYIAQGVLPTLGGPFDVPLIIQDRMFYPDGRLAYPDQPFAGAAGCAPWPGGPSTLPEFFGDCMVVNGKTWPVLDVEPAKYRLRFLNGCNSRFLDLAIQPSSASSFTIIGTEGGLLPSAVVRGNLLMGPAERFDVIFDFSRFAGQTLVLTNKGAKKPFPKGTPPRPGVDGVVLQFRVRRRATIPAQITRGVPPILNATPTPLSKAAQAAGTRRVLLFEGVDPFGRIQPLLGHVMGTPPAALSAMPMMWSDPISENPAAGSVEIWEIYNTTMDSHPVHIHEILFGVLNRQPISFDKKAAMAVCGMPMAGFPIALKGKARSSEAYEQGFKDTVIAYPGEVTRIVADFTGAKPGRFVWHCHILEHEDHEMMRPYDVI